MRNNTAEPFATAWINPVFSGHRTLRGVALFRAACPGCGTEKLQSKSNLERNDMCSACSRRTKPRRYVHGKSNTRVYQQWKDMHRRCTNPAATGYANYGGRGICVCPEWGDIHTFLADMGPCPPKYQLDRVDTNGNYCKENCRWVTQKENLQNRRDVLQITHENTTKPATEWARDVGISVTTLKWRLRAGWPLAAAVSTPGNQGKRTSRSPR